MKQLLNGFTAPIEQVDMEAFKKALFGFIADLGSAGGKIVCATPGGTEGLDPHPGSGQDNRFKWFKNASKRSPNWGL